MAGFDAIYKQTITLFNRVKNSYGEETLWYPTIIEGVHLIVDKSATWNNQGGQASDNAKLNVRYKVSGDEVLISCIGADGKPFYKRWYEPKAWSRLEKPEEGLTFSFGNNDDFDFFVEGIFTEMSGPISDDLFERKGFYNYMNAKYDNVFAIAGAAKYNLIPHFEIVAR